MAAHTWHVYIRVCVPFMCLTRQSHTTAGPSSDDNALVEEVVALVNANGDGFVGDKLAKKDPPVPIIPYQDRMRLLDMATQV